MSRDNVTRVLTESQVRRIVVSLVRDYEEYNLLLRHFDPVTNPITYNIYIIYSLTFSVRLPVLHRT